MDTNKNKNVVISNWIKTDNNILVDENKICWVKWIKSSNLNYCNENGNRNENGDNCIEICLSEKCDNMKDKYRICKSTNAENYYKVIRNFW